MITKKLEALKDKAVRLADVEKSVLGAVDHLDKKETARFPLSPSAALKPMRDLYYGLVNYYEPGTITTDPLPAQTKLTFKMGHMIENMLVDYFREAFHLKDEQRRVVFGSVTDANGKTIELGGNIDWAVKIGGETILMDSKSSGSYPFKLAPKEDNIAQMQLYMHSDWGKKNNVTKAILAYFNKDNSELKCMQIDYDPILAEAIIERLKTVWEYYKRRELPPREYVLGVDWQANYSMYRTHDNAEFMVPVELRPVVVINTKAPKVTKDLLKEAVLAYGNAIIQYTDKSVYITSNGKSLDVQTLGEKIWSAV